MNLSADVYYYPWNRKGLLTLIRLPLSEAIVLRLGHASVVGLFQMSEL